MSEECPEEWKSCFICKIDFKMDDPIVEFFGGYAHFSCFDKRMKENKARKDGNRNNDKLR